MAALLAAHSYVVGAAIDGVERRVFNKHTVFCYVIRLEWSDAARTTVLRSCKVGPRKNE